MGTTFKNLQKQKYFNEIGYGLAALVCAYLLFPIGFEFSILPYKAEDAWWTLLDSSWMITLNYLKIHHFTWGTDFVFTYGPLGQLSTRVGWGENRYLFLFFDLFVFVNWLLTFYFALKSSANKPLTLVMMLLLGLFLPNWIGGRISLYLLLFLTFWTRQSIEHKTILSYVMQISILVICFFIKFNSAFVCLPIYYMGIGYMAYRKNLNLKEILLYSLTPLLLIYLLSFYLNVSLYHYISTGFDIISGYNEIMYEEFPLAGTSTYLMAITLLLSVIVVVNFFSRKDQDILKRLVIVALSAIPFFIAYKQGFVRSNPGYNSDFFACVLVYGVTNSDLHYAVKNRLLNVLLLCSAVVAIHYLYIKSEKPFETTAKINKSNYWNGFQNFTTNSDRVFKSEYIKFPANILHKLKNQTVDVYPWNIRMLIENDVNYLPRPVIQSYSSYTPMLEDLNFAMYNDPARAPQYVLYEYGSLDSRYSLFDESKVNIALKVNYTLDETFDYGGKKILLLKKKPDFKKVSFEKTKEYAMLLNSPLVPKKNTFYTVTMYNTLKGKMYSVIKHAPELKLEIQIKGGSKVEFKTSKKLLEAGIFEDNVIEKTEDFGDILTSGQSAKKARYYNFKPYDDSMFDEKIKITEYKIKY